MISVVVPFFNEEDSVSELHRRLISVLHKGDTAFEIIFVDDCSTDKTFDRIKILKPVIGLRLSKNSGQSAALAAGIRKACGDIIVTLDGDLENHPEDIPDLLKKIGEGYDVVSGWRKRRWNTEWLLRRLPSLAANRLISSIGKVHLHDNGCALKAYRKNIFDFVDLRGERHRMIAAYAAAAGARVAEIEVQYSPRRFGRSKYGLMRIFKVLLDVFALAFFYRYAARPIHFFGGIGFGGLSLGVVAFFVMVYLRLFQHISFISTPLPTLVALFFIIGVQFILLGLLAEIFIQRRPESGAGGRIFIREEVVNVG